MHVVSTLLLGSTGATHGYINTDDNLYVNIDANGDSAGNAFIIGHDGIDIQSELFRVQENGNVGIGTAEPGTKLEVFGSTGNLLTVQDGSNAVRIGTDAQGGRLTMDGASDFKFRTVTNGDLVTIKGGGNVGIGTTNPTEKLYVSGNIYATGSVTYTGSALDGWTDGGASVYTTTSTDNVGIGTTGPLSLLQVAKDVDTVGGTTFDTTTQFNVTGTTDPKKRLQMGFDTTGNFGFVRAVHVDTGLKPLILQPDTGNVGIGTTGPGAKLDVAGAIIINSGQKISSRGGLWLSGASGEVDLYDGASAHFFDIYNGAAGNIRLHSNGNSYFIGGNVGIGTTGPGARLDIDSNSNSQSIRMRGAAETTEIADFYIGVDGPLIIDNTPGTGTNSYIDLRPEDDNYGLLLRESDGTGTGAYANFYVVDSGTNDYINLIVNGIQSTTGLVVTQAGNVGIGTTSPGAPLEVSRSSAAADVLYLRDTGTGTPGLRLYSTNNPNNPFAVYAYDNSYFSVGIIGTGEYLNIKRDGNVGIGETSPGSLLSVKGGISVGETTDYSQKAAPTGGMIIKGNVGIGTTAPGAGLEVVTATNVGARITTGDIVRFDLYSTAAGTRNWTLLTNIIAGGDFALKVSDAQQGNPYSAGSYVLHALSNGSVGIGTTNPQRRLHLIGDLYTSIRLDGTSGGQVVLGTGSTEKWGMYTLNDILRFYWFGTGAGDKVVINSSGNVGIGTTNPTVKLSVVGGRIAQDTWTADGDVAVQYDTGGTNALGIATSDRRLKKDFEPLKGGLKKTLDFQGLLYRDKDQQDTDKKKLGLIAQDVLKVCPEAVFEYKDEKGESYYGVHYERLVVILIEAMKEQQEQIQELKQEVNRICRILPQLHRPN